VSSFKISVAALWGSPRCRWAGADPTDDAPDAVRLDPEYATGKAAIEAKERTMLTGNKPLTRTLLIA
jgi:hypothetical protein